MRPDLRWLVVGAGGMLGRDVVDVLTGAGERITAARRADVDITDARQVAAAIPGHDVVVNCAGWTDVDGAETQEAAATAVNGGGVANLARVCADTGARLLHISTDYVFSGDATQPYPENAPTGPINAYGRSKLVGEHTVTALLPDAGYVVRTAWLYGRHGNSFVHKILYRLAECGHVDVVDDQWGQPTWTRVLARQLLALGRSTSVPPGVYHAVSQDHTTWHEFAAHAACLAGYDPRAVRPTLTPVVHDGAAPRPTWTVLGSDRWTTGGLTPLPGWRDQLDAACYANTFEDCR